LLQAASYKLQAASYKLQATSCMLQAFYFSLFISQKYEMIFNYKVFIRLQRVIVFFRLSDSGGFAWGEHRRVRLFSDQSYFNIVRVELLSKDTCLVVSSCKDRMVWFDPSRICGLDGEA
jgi:hypothetical protein